MHGSWRSRLQSIWVVILISIKDVSLLFSNHSFSWIFKIAKNQVFGCPGHEDLTTETMFDKLRVFWVRLYMVVVRLWTKLKHHLNCFVKIYCWVKYCVSTPRFSNFMLNFEFLELFPIFYTNFEISHQKTAS